MPLEEAERSRLRWRCRRGMLELDVLLNSYLDTAPDLTPETVCKLEALLDYPDQVLLELLLGHTQSVDEHINQLVSMIRKSTGSVSG